MDAITNFLFGNMKKLAQEVAVIFIMVWAVHTFVFQSTIQSLIQDKTAPVMAGLLAACLASLVYVCVRLIWIYLSGKCGRRMVEQPDKTQAPEPWLTYIKREGWITVLFSIPYFVYYGGLVAIILKPILMYQPVGMLWAGFAGKLILACILAVATVIQPC